MRGFETSTPTQANTLLQGAVYMNLTFFFATKEGVIEDVGFCLFLVKGLLLYRGGVEDTLYSHWVAPFQQSDSENYLFI